MQELKKKKNITNMNIIDLISIISITKNVNAI